MTTKKNKVQRSKELQEYAVKAHSKNRDELLKRQLSNTENYDKSILTLSSTGLILSLSFLKFLIPNEDPQYISLIITSWTCFITSIILSLVAYRISNLAIEKQLEIAYDYYIDQNDQALERKNKWSNVNTKLNDAVGIIFVSAMLTLVIFVIINLNPQENNTMTKKNQNNNGNRVTTQDSANVPQMERIPTPSSGDRENSAEVPNMEKLPNNPKK